MNSREARLILGTHRSDGRYADDDPLFREALAEATHDPQLAGWLQREHAQDEAVARQLDAITPPAGLREAILVGARASQIKRSWWRRTSWIAAACVVLAANLAAMLHWFASERLSPAGFARLALQEKATHPHDHAYAAPLAAIQRELGERAQPFTAGLSVDVDRLRGAGCASLAMNGRDVYELCFQNGGTWYHLYVTRLESAGPPERDRQPVFVHEGGLVAASWSDGLQLYTLVTAAPIATLQRLV